MLASLSGCSKLLGISDPVAGDATGGGDSRLDSPMDDAMIDSSIDAPPPCAAPNMFGSEMSFDVGAAATGFAVGKLDPGAALDVAIAVGTQVVILHGDGTGQFANPTIVDTPAVGVAIDDFDIDVRNDLIIWSGNNIVERRQNSAAPGTFLAEQPLPGTFQNVANAVIENFDGNFVPDVIVQDDVERRAFSSNLGTPGTFSSTNQTPGSAGDDLLLARDIDNADRSDAVFVDQAGNVKLSLGVSPGGLQAVATIAAGATGHAAAFGNFNGDALLDLVIATAAGGKLFLQNAGNPGTFTAAPGTIPGVIGSTLYVTDVNGDGTDDIVAPGSIVMQCPGPPGVFTQVESINATAPVVLVDVNGNGKPDLLRLSGTSLIVRLQ